MLRAAGIDYEIVPGVTVALAAASYAGVPLTGRQLASAVALVAGHEEDDKAAALDYGLLANFPGTLVFYMGVTTVDAWSGALLRGGMPSDTPVTVVRRCTWPDQELIRTTLALVASEVRARKLRPPAIAIVGEAAAAEPLADWFTSRPLYGSRVMITRPVDQADALREQLAELGADVLVQPAIEIAPPPSWAPVDAALARLGDFAWLVFSSANGVRYLLDRLLTTADLRRLAGARLAAIGPATAEELLRYQLRADLVPADYRAEELAAALAQHVRGERVLLARASRGREVLADQLSAAGAIVEQIVVYESRDVASPEGAIAEDLAAGRVDWVTVTSSAIARSLAAMFGTDLHKSRLASISPVTSRTLIELGYDVAAEATEYTTHGLVRAMLGN